MMRIRTSRSARAGSSMSASSIPAAVCWAVYGGSRFISPRCRACEPFIRRRKLAVARAAASRQISHDVVDRRVLPGGRSDRGAQCAHLAATVCHGRLPCDRSNRASRREGGVRRDRAHRRFFTGPQHRDIARAMQPRRPRLHAMPCRQLARHGAQSAHVRRHRCFPRHGTLAVQHVGRLSRTAAQIGDR